MEELLKTQFEKEERRIHEIQVYLKKLQVIPGIGKKRKQLILRHFKSVKRLRKATLNEIMLVLGPKLAEVVFSYLKSHPEQAITSLKKASSTRLTLKRKKRSRSPKSD